MATQKRRPGQRAHLIAEGYESDIFPAKFAGACGLSDLRFRPGEQVAYFEGKLCLPAKIDQELLNRKFKKEFTERGAKLGLTQRPGESDADFSVRVTFREQGLDFPPAPVLAPAVEQAVSQELVRERTEAEERANVGSPVTYRKNYEYQVTLDLNLKGYRGFFRKLGDHYWEDAGFHPDPVGAANLAKDRINQPRMK